MVENSKSLDKLFGSKTRTKLLNLFFNNSDKSFYVREITRLVDEQINSVRRELSNLQALGIVKSDTYDNKLYYMVNDKYRHATHLEGIFSDGSKQSKPKVVGSKKLDDWEIAIKPIKPLVSILLIANGSNDLSGDVDMLVVGNDKDGKISKWAGLIEKKQNKPLNYVVLSDDDFYYRKSVKDRFLTNILTSDMVVILDKNNSLTDNKE